jgi:hypothetical protein
MGHSLKAIEEFSLAFDHFTKTSRLLAIVRTERCSHAFIDTVKKRGTEEAQSTSEGTAGGGQANPRGYEGIRGSIVCMVRLATGGGDERLQEEEVVADYVEQATDKQSGISGR